MKCIKICLKNVNSHFMSNWWKYLIYALIVLLIIFGCHFTINSSEIREPTITDYCVYIFGGIKEYTPSLTEFFNVPFSWIIIHIIPLIFTANIITSDFSVYGQQRIYRIGNRKTWWAKKCLQIVGVLSNFYCVIFLELAIFTLIFGLKLVPYCSIEINSVIDFGKNNITNMNLDLIIESTILPFLFTLSLSYLQSILSLWIKPINSLIVSLVILFSSAYYVNPWIIGNYSMAVRSSKVITNGVNPLIGIAFYILIISISITLGFIKIKKIDIINREERHEGGF